ncbi:MAG TPA: T9SS type A sorting domain-containing protein [Saprospiraceae bacterium]|nr:T9SS type A sorting domain-containing protein [Saprospiraceae bacterium]
MKYFSFAFLILFTIDLYGQPWYSRMYDFNGQEIAKSMTLSGDSIFVRINNICSENNIICSILGNYSTSDNDFVKINRYENIQGGYRDVILLPNTVLLSSQESTFNEYISLSIIDRSSLDFIDSISLNIDSNRYFSYVICPSILYFDRVILGANVLDSLNFVNYSGWFNYQQDAVLFSLNLNLEIDTILVIPPSSGAFLRIEDMAIGPDSVLYISFYEKYLEHGSSKDYLETRKVIYGYDKNLRKVFQWIGPDFDSYETLSCLTIGQDSIIYVNYKRNYRYYVAALNRDGTVKWECTLDPSFGQALYSVTKLIQTKNKDIVGVGVISSITDELGESGFLFRIDSVGTLLWKRAIRINKGFDPILPPGLPFQSGLEDVRELPNGDLMAIGFVRKYVSYDDPDGPYDNDAWIVRTNGDGCIWDNCPFIQDIVDREQYMRILSSNNEWVIDVVSPPLPTAIHRFRFDPDSILIDNKPYYKLIYSPTIEGNWEETNRLMREDSGRVYELNLIDTTEILLYDFNFQVGDTMSSHQDGTDNRRQVISVGTVVLADELPRKTITIECTSNTSTPDTTVWIEGIGDAERLFWSKTFCSTLDSDDSIAAIRCFLTNDLWMYSRPGLLEGCYITAVEHLEPELLSVFPNPNSGILHFQIGPDQVADRIVIYNSFGILVFSSENWTSDHILDLSSQPSGIYHGWLYFKDKTVRTFKTIITK